jgi:hypothetical protein
MAKPLTTVVKPEVPAYSKEKYAKLESELSHLKGHHLFHIFGNMKSKIELFQKLDKEFESVAGSPEKANREKLRLAVESAGSIGLPLAYAQFFIRDPKDLTEARKFHTRTKDEDGNEIAPVIKEVRGKNNETTLFLVQPEDKKPADEEAPVEEGGDETEA